MCQPTIQQTITAHTTPEYPNRMLLRKRYGMLEKMVQAAFNRPLILCKGTRKTTLQIY